MRNFKMDTLFYVVIALFMLFAFIMFPKQGLDAAIQGIHIWWDVLFPSLFPFIVISELLLGYGIVHFIGSLLDPLMRPLFRVPGSGGFVMAMGFASGYPVGARLTSQLWEQRLIGRDEGERLVSFTSTSDPIFLIGAVSIGFFHDAGLALIIVSCHYGGGIIVGLLMRYHGNKQAGNALTETQKYHRHTALIRAFKAMHHARLADMRPFGIKLKDAIQSSIHLVFVIGGLVVFFSVMLEFMKMAGLMVILYNFIGFILQLLNIPASFSNAVINGLFEVTLGAQTAGAAGAEFALQHKVAIAVFILSWSGLSVHAQIMSILNQTNIRYYPFFIARLMHGVISTVLVYILWPPLSEIKEAVRLSIPSYVPYGSATQLTVWLVSSAMLVFAGTFLIIIILFMAYRLLKWVSR